MNLLTIEQLAEVLPYKPGTLRKYKRTGIIHAEIDNGGKATFNLETVMEDLKKNAQKRVKRKGGKS